MRRLLVVLVFFVGCLVSNAQETGQYGLYIRNGIAKNDYKDLFYTSFYIRVNDGSEMLSYNSHENFKKWATTPVPDAEVTHYNISNSPRPKKLIFHTRLRTAGVIWEDKEIHYDIDCSNPPMSRTLKNPFWGAISESTVEFKPVEIKFWYFEGDGSGTVDNKKYLPYDQTITLKATTGFPESIYQWQFSIDSGSNWQDFPATLNYSQNKSVVTFQGRELGLTEGTFIGLIGSQSIMIKLNIIAGSQEQLILQPCYSVPNIIGIPRYDKETCRGDNNATVYLNIDRPLINGEVIEMYTDGFATLQGVTSVENQTVSLTQVKASGALSLFSLKGSVNKTKSYDTGPNHSAKIKIDPAVEIKYNSSQHKPVGCFNGKDGEASVTITQGEDAWRYKISLKRAGAEDQVVEHVPKNKPVVFAGLVAGVYHVEVFKQNAACKATPTDVAQETITITQPAAAVQVVHQEDLLKMPRGHCEEDGEATFRIVGGTTPYKTVEVIHQDNSRGKLLKISQDSPDSYLYTFDNLKRGAFFVYVKDNNYDGLADQNKGDYCTCAANTSFKMPAPPPLEVEIEETHFVTCYGSDQGQLTAHAKGGVPYEGRSPYNYRWYMVNNAGQARLTIPNDSIAHNLTSGRYKVEVIDSNGIAKRSHEFFLDQPDSLSLRFEVQSVGCSSVKNGAVEAFVTGGTEPYTYQWSVEGQNKSHIEGISAGIYMFKVTDARGCQLIRTIEVPSASGLKVESAVVQPTCRTPQGGRIELNISGATPPYTVKWSDSQTTEAIRPDLDPGKYDVVVSDANNCSASYSFNLAAPKVFSVSLGDDLTMCRNQQRVIEATSQEKNLSYEWFLNGTKIEGSKSELSVNEAGVYKVVVTNPDGCTAWDEITIHVSHEILDLDLAVPTTAAVGSEIHAVNLSTVAAERIVWNLPQGAQIKSQSDTEVVFTVPSTGSYPISMEGFKGDCSTKVYRTLNVVGVSGADLPENKEPLIRQFLVTPNPTTGYFKVLVELNREENFTMLLYAPSGALMDRKEGIKTQNKTFEYEINGTIVGTYMLHLQTKVDKSVLQVVVERK